MLTFAGNPRRRIWRDYNTKLPIGRDIWNLITHPSTLISTRTPLCFILFCQPNSINNIICTNNEKRLCTVFLVSTGDLGHRLVLFSLNNKPAKHSTQISHLCSQNKTTHTHTLYPQRTSAESGPPRHVAQSSLFNKATFCSALPMTLSILASTSHSLVTLALALEACGATPTAHSAAWYFFSLNISTSFKCV